MNQSSSDRCRAIFLLLDLIPSGFTKGKVQKPLCSNTGNREPSYKEVTVFRDLRAEKAYDFVRVVTRMRACACDPWTRPLVEREDGPWRYTESTMKPRRPLGSGISRELDAEEVDGSEQDEDVRVAELRDYVLVTFQ